MNDWMNKGKNKKWTNEKVKENFNKERKKEGGRKVLNKW